ncbi:MAG TPA: hypothetical protein VFH63_00105 [candidate division Zixibacteria bacterium]|nr:hypothetical protein [candidate division Zixibacteria bacterium]
MIYPLLLPAAVVLQQAISWVEPPGFVRPLLVSIGSAGIVMAVLTLALRRVAVAGLLTLLIGLMLFSRDPILAFLTLLRDTLGIQAATVVLGVMVFLLTAGLVFAYLLNRRGSLRTPSMSTVTSGLNAFSLLLLAVILVPAVPQIPGWVSDAVPRQRAAAVDAPPPDVFLFVLDEYPRSDELDRLFGIANDDFTDDLSARGFTVDPSSHSNYTYTALTLISMLELQHLSAETDLETNDEALRTRLRAALRNGAGMRALRDAGYRIVATAPGWEHVALRAGVDQYVDRPELTDLERIVLQRTWIPDLPPVPGDLFFRDLHARVTGILDDAGRVAEEAGEQPVFTFVHVPAPHLPFAFGADGGPAAFTSREYGAGRPSEFGLTADGFARTYEQSLNGLNQRLLQTIDRVLVAAPDAVVVVMSDHGYRGDAPVHGPEHLRNLLAFRTPGAPDLLTGVTPVNLIRALLDEYAGLDLGEPVPDRYFTTEIDGTHWTLREISDPG